MEKFQTAPSVNRFEMGYEDRLVAIWAGQVFETDDPRLAEQLDRQPAVIRAAPAMTRPAPSRRI